MSAVADDNRKAKAMGMSYGEYKAYLYQQEKKETRSAPRPHKRAKARRRYTDAQAFSLWQEGRTDEEIGTALGVSRQLIQRWRDTMELPSTAIYEVDTSRYRLVQQENGVFAVLDDVQP